MDAGEISNEALVRREEFLFEQLGSRITALGEDSRPGLDERFRFHAPPHAIG